MSDLISRQAAIEATCYNCTEKEVCNGICDDTDRLRELPTIDPVENGGCWGCQCALLGQAPVKKYGEWIDNKVAFHFVCSECGCTVRMDKGQVFDRIEDEYNYCPNFGAKMDGGEE